MKAIPFTRILTLFLTILFSSLQSQADYLLDILTKEKATKSGITVKSRPNGDAGTKVWLEVERDGPLGDFSFIELRMEDKDGEHLLSTRLQPHPVIHGQSGDIITTSFSAELSLLRDCSFYLCKGKNSTNRHGGEILIIRISNFLDLPQEPSL